MKYYEGREASYRKIEDIGLSNWDELTNSQWSLKDSKVFQELQSGLLSDLVTENTTALNVLEIGCGTGSLSLFLAKQGLKCTGIDVSETAIRIANKRATQRGLPVTFEVRDICHCALDGKYDLIVDEHCLHCLVHDSDRTAALVNVRQSLAPQGKFIIEAMVSDVGMAFGENFQLDEDGMLWNVSGTPKSEPWQRRDDLWYFPNCIIIDESAFIAELIKARFEIREGRRIAPDKPGDPATYLAVCSLSSRG
jgi:2-polyprenyl-3-methyl-5-hydroxy-6-metoxy-1,4-benzoquinol methylase